jgi:dTMP kinase
MDDNGERGLFITFEGGDGSGKSTQVGLLVKALEATGIPVVRTREPGGAPGAEDIRRLLVEGEPSRWDPESEALLMVAARRNHLVGTIWPALDAGQWVVSDRFADSTLAYQGFGHGLDIGILKALHRLIAPDFTPDLTLVLDLPVDVAHARAAARPGAETRFERMSRDFHDRLRRGYLQIANEEPARCVVIPALGDPETVHKAVLHALSERLGLAL